MTRRFAFALVAVLLTPGCYRVRIVNGRPIDPGPPALPGAWRSQVGSDIIVADRPDNLAQRCPNGWAEVEAYDNVANTLVSWFTPFYRASTVTVRCSSAPLIVPVSETLAPVMVQ